MRVLISVSNKEGIIEFAEKLIELGAQIVSTGGTAQLLNDHDIAVQAVSELTDFPEVMDGRVKTLHPYIYAGILSRDGVENDQAVLKQFNIQAFDIVVVNLYPFVKTLENPNSSKEDIIENIDIGGPCMLRAAAKNHARVTVIVDPKDYDNVADALNNNRQTSLQSRFHLAAKAFKYCADYDAHIAKWFLNQNLPDHNYARCSENSSIQLPETLHLESQSMQSLRYGENPHQQAAFYRLPNAAKDSISNIKQHQGKPMSYNNIMDADVALELVKKLDKHACVIVKHNCPCGVAQAEDALSSYQLAFSCDSESAFGGIISFNQTITDVEAKYIINNQFFEIIIAPFYNQEALTLLAQKKNVRVLQYQNPERQEATNDWEIRQVGGGLLYQQKDYPVASEFSVVTKKQPDQKTWDELYFSWNIVRSVKSNAIVCTHNGQTLGIGGGQTSRVMAAELAYMKSQKAGLAWSEAVMASDAFFPFKDSIEFAGKKGIKAIIQPGGSLRDEEVIEAANKHDMIMVFTHYRCFKH